MTRKLIDDLSDEFKIVDRQALNNAISRAAYAYVEKSDGMPDFRGRDTLDEVAGILKRACELLTDPLNGNRLAQHLRMHAPEFAAANPFYVLDVTRFLSAIRCAAADAHRERAQTSGPLPRADLAAAMAVLVNYWKKDLDRRFTRDQKWAKGKDGQLEPVTEGERFIYRVIRSFPSAPPNEKIRGAMRALSRQLQSSPTFSDGTL